MFVFYILETNKVHKRTSTYDKQLEKLFPLYSITNFIDIDNNDTAKNEYENLTENTNNKC